jgi:hypothetical protein
MKIGDICLIRKGQRINNINLIEGIRQRFTIPVYGDSDKIISITNNFNREGETIKISLYNEPKIILLNEQYYLNDKAFTIESTNQNLLTNNFLYFYLKNNSNLIQYTGIAQRKINMDHFINIEIPIPSIIRQNEIINNIFNYDSEAIQNRRNYINNLLQNI